MEKKLSELSLEELWQLFPIELTEHNPEWKDWAAAEMAYLRDMLGEYAVSVNHIGSTAIPGIMAKPIIDILVEIKANADRSVIRNRMEAAGYICMNESTDRMSFNKGYTPSGYAGKVYHIHFHNIGDNAEIAFRDYLISHPEEAREYERLKLSLLPQYRHNRDGYTAAKSDFINKISGLADFS